MSHEADHIALANRNQGVLDHLLTDMPRCAEWIAVVAFYKATHIVEAIFSQDPDPTIQHTSHHKIRLRKLKTNPRYNSLYIYFRGLWSASTVARYLEDQKTGIAYASFSGYLPHDQIVPKLLDRYLAQFETRASQLLSKASAKAIKSYKSPPVGSP